MGDHLGYISLVIGLVGIAMTILWPTKRAIGYSCLGLAFVVALFWAYSWFTTKPELKKITPIISWFPAPITEGDSIDYRQLNAQVFVDGVPLDGQFIYNPALGATLPAGSDTLFVKFVPFSSSFNTVEKTAVLSVAGTATKSVEPASSNAPRPTMRFEGVNYITVDGSGSATLPIWISFSGFGTVHYRGLSYSRAMSPAPKDLRQGLRDEDEFWKLYLEEKRQHPIGPITSAAAGVGKTLLELELGPEISKNLPILKTKGGGNFCCP